MPVHIICDKYLLNPQVMCAVFDALPVIFVSRVGNQLFETTKEKMERIRAEPDRSAHSGVLGSWFPRPLDLAASSPAPLSGSCLPFQVPLPPPGWLWVGLGCRTQNRVCVAGSSLSLPPGATSPGSTGQVSLRLPYKAGAGRSLVGLVLCRLWMLTGGCGGGWGDRAMW